MTPLTSELVVLIAGHPVSVNHMYARGNRKLYKTPEAARWETTAAYHVRIAAQRLWGLYDLSEYKGYPLHVEMIVMRPTWLGKTKAKRGLYVRPDVTNFIKSAEDVLCRTLNLDDSAVIRFVATKGFGRLDQTMLKLRVMEKGSSSHAGITAQG